MMSILRAPFLKETVTDTIRRFSSRRIWVKVVKKRRFSPEQSDPRARMTSPSPDHYPRRRKWPDYGGTRSGKRKRLKLVEWTHCPRSGGGIIKKTMANTKRFPRRVIRRVFFRRL